MEERRMNVIFTKGGSGSVTTKLTIPKKWIDKLGITKEKRGIVLKFYEEAEKIVIEKEKAMIETLSYVLGTKTEVEEGKEYYFGELYDGEDMEEILSSGCVAMWDDAIEEERIVDFDVVELDENDLLSTMVRVKEIR